MKIRNGFVSNSSSSSFIIDIPKEDLSLSQVEEYYKFKEGLDDTTKGVMTFLIWRTIKELKRRSSVEGTEFEYGYDDEYSELGDNIETGAEISDDFVNSCEYCAHHEYFSTKYGYSDKYTENVKRMKENGLEKFKVEVDNSGWDGEGAIRILSNRDKQRLDKYSEVIFDKDADEIHAIGIDQH